MGEKFVTISTEQTVVGQKTFMSNLIAGGGLDLKNNTSILFNGGDGGAIGHTA